MELQGRNLSLEMRGDDVALLHSELSRLPLGVSIPPAEIERRLFGNGTQAAVIAFQRQNSLRPTGVVDQATAVGINAAVDAIAPPSYVVSGRVIGGRRAGIGGLRVEIVDVGAGSELKVAQSVTDSAGAYRTAFGREALADRNKSRPDLQARVFAGRTLAGSSAVRYNASARETLNVRLQEPAESALPSEYETLRGALASHFAGPLRELQENDQRQDITYLANKTGWDARAVALAVLADQASERTTDPAGNRALEPEFFYTLFRAGVPAEESALYRTTPQTAERMWRQAARQGVLPSALAARIPQAVERFSNLSALRLLDSAASPGASSLGEMLALSLGEQDGRQRRFAELYARHRHEPERLWQAVREAFGEAVEKRLRIDGQLGFLTLDNAPLIRNLHRRAGPSGLPDPAGLVAAGYFRAQRWLEDLGDSRVPGVVPGRDEEQRRRRYAELMAAQIRLGYPTAVVAEMVRSGETPVPEALRDRVHAFLSGQQGRFDIGLTPIGQFLARSGLTLAPEIAREIKRIQRVYQITSSDGAMNALLRSGVDSAWAVARYDRGEFVRTFAAELGGGRNAELIHAKAQQVHNAALNIATHYLISGTIPAIGAHGPSQILNPSPGGSEAGDVIAYPTLEGLFGQLDFCSCEHCRSILSPAAYLVDLLLFCDRPVNDKENPLDVLLERRPDIQHLPLTCRNTNTPLPAIDLVNETLEYFVANQLSLSGYAGHDTDGSIGPEDLLAGPQFVTDAAYTVLLQERFPPPLPFHRALESMRRYFDRFETPLPRVMEVLRLDDSLERPSPQGYGWRDILMEELRLSRAEHAILTDGSLTLQQLYGYDAAVPEAQVRAELANVKALTRRAGISYEELVEILHTRFMNPNAHLIPKLERLGVPFSTLKALKDGTLSDAGFEALLPPGLDASQYGGSVTAWVKDDPNYARIMSLITLANPGNEGDLCSFDKVELRYSNPDVAANALPAFDYVRLVRFIRLWKKVGWTVHQTDAAIAALYPPELAPTGPDEAVNRQRLEQGFLVLLPRLGVVRRAIAALELSPKRDLLPLLACFAPIDTAGPDSLYRLMFLSAPADERDPAFADDGFGGFLTDPATKLVAHAATLRAAFRLTGVELGEIVSALGFDEGTPLTLANISAVFRRGWLARELRLSVREFLLLARFAGFDPFAAPDPPAPPVLSLAGLVGRMRAASLKPVQALYLTWNQDVSGRSAPDDDEVLGLAGNLRSGLAAVESEFAAAGDPTGEIARARMAQVYGNEAADFFFGLLENTLATAISYSHVSPSLEPAVVAVAPGRISYDDFRKRLSFTGVLSTAVLDALKAAASAELAAAVDGLYAENRKVAGSFFARYPELEPLHDAYAASGAPPEQKRSQLLASFLPELVRRRKQQQVLQAMASVAKAELSLARTVLGDAGVMHAAGDATRPAADDLSALDAAGLSAVFFDGDTAAGPAAATSEAEPDLVYAAGTGNPLPANSQDPDAAISGVWSGYLQVPEDSFYTLRVDAEADSSVTFLMDDKPVSLARNGSTWTSSEPLELRAAILHPVSLLVEKIKDSLSVQLADPGSGLHPIPARHLYPATTVERLRSVYTRFLKTASLAAALKLGPDDLAHFATRAELAIGGAGWLNSLPAAGDPDPATSAALLSVLDTLLEFARLKAQISRGDGRLLTVLTDPVAATAAPGSALPALTGWDPDSLDALLARFGASAADLGRIPVFGRVEAVFALLKKLRVPAPALIAAATNEPGAAAVRDFREALRARYADRDWNDVLRPINDELREARRDALVSHVLHRMKSNPATAHIDTPDKLFEYFLVDVQMAACSQTSRVRHALSSVQLFIERCLMNLEPRVDSGSIKAGQWEWMRRYRVWEANRKVFLYPENWLEPELRDDPSPIFTETMSELLQSDITEDKAAAAFLRYLSNLHEVAMLEPCGIHYVEKDPGAADDVAHVLARTSGGKSKYYYRRREYGCWTPWEPVDVDVEDNPVLPLVWKGRLFLFWLKMLQRVPLTPPSLPGGELSGLAPSDVVSQIATSVEYEAVLYWSEYFDGEWLPPRTSDVGGPAFVDRLPPGQFRRNSLRLAAKEKGDGLEIIILGESPGASCFVMHNSHSLPVWGTKVNYVHALPRVLDTPGSTFTIEYADPAESDGFLSRAVLQTPLQARAVQPLHALGDARSAPFLYADSRHVFYVTTEQRKVRLPGWQLYGVVSAFDRGAVEIPPMVFRKIDLPPDRIGPLVSSRTQGAVDTAPMQRFVTEDAYIDKGLGTTGAVRFGNRRIVAAGSIAGPVAAE